MKKLTLLTLLFVSLIYSQSVSFSFSTDIVSRYIWRGSEYGKFNLTQNSPHIQPTAAFTYSKDDSFSASLGFWGSYGFNGDYSESDIYVNFYIPTNFMDFSCTFNDYFYPFYGLSFSNFEGDGLGAHTIEANLSMTLKDTPIRLMLSKNIHNDIPDDNSFYVELGYSFALDPINLDLFCGMAKGTSVWHSVSTDKFEFINIGFTAKKDIRVSESFTIPAAFSWIYNPHQKITYLVGKITL